VEFSFPFRRRTDWNAVACFLIQTKNTRDEKRKSTRRERADFLLRVTIAATNQQPAPVPVPGEFDRLFVCVFDVVPLRQLVLVLLFVPMVPPVVLLVPMPVALPLGEDTPPEADVPPVAEPAAAPPPAPPAPAPPPPPPPPAAKAQVLETARAVANKIVVSFMEFLRSGL
jgi:hypothetical protein